MEEEEEEDDEGFLISQSCFSSTTRVSPSFFRGAIINFFPVCVCNYNKRNESFFLLFFLRNNSLGKDTRKKKYKLTMGCFRVSAQHDNKQLKRNYLSVLFLAKKTF